MTLVPVLEVGGTHVTAALVRTGDWTVVAVERLGLDADGPADELLRRFAEAADRLAPDVPVDVSWGVAMPDPFDYARGVAWFEGVGKFAALHGVDVRAGLLEHLAVRPARLCFLNDADAFALGEWTAGAAAGAARATGITLGTGVGSGWLVDGRVVDPGTPPGGRIHLMTVDGAPLEDVMSRRAIRRRFAAAGGDPSLDVVDVARLARDGDARAAGVIGTAVNALGRVVGPLVRAFGSDVLVVGGSMAASWDLFEGPFRTGAGELPPVRIAQDSSRAPLIGAAAATLTP